MKQRTLCAQLHHFAPPCTTLRQAVRLGAGICSVWPPESSSCKAASCFHSCKRAVLLTHFVRVDAAGSRPLRSAKARFALTELGISRQNAHNGRSLQAPTGPLAALIAAQLLPLRGHWSHPDGGLYSGQRHGQAGTSTNRMLLSCLCCPTASYTASQNTVARTSTVWLSHITDILPSVLSFQRTVLAACSPAPACTHKAVLVSTYPSVV